MSDLDGFEPIDPMVANVRSDIGRAVMAFIASGNECMGKRYDDADKLVSDMNKARNFVRYHVRPKGLCNVKVRRRGDMLVLIRDDGDA